MLAFISRKITVHQKEISELDNLLATNKTKSVVTVLEEPFF